MSAGDVGGFKKGFSWALKYDKITTNNVVVKYVSGACKYNSGDKPGARRDWQTAETLLQELESVDSWSEADRNMMKLGVLHTAKAMMEANQKDSARTLLGKVAQWFEEDSDWQVRYDEIVNQDEGYRDIKRGLMPLFYFNMKACKTFFPNQGFNFIL